jgi:hypothetical protein
MTQDASKRDTLPKGKSSCSWDGTTSKGVAFCDIALVEIWIDLWMSFDLLNNDNDKEIMFKFRFKFKS